jgi:hypothetical protein
MDVEENYYKRAFYSYFRNLGYSKEDIKKYLVYAGGDGASDPLHAKHHEYFQAMAKRYSLSQPNPEKKCVCTHWIEKQRYLMDTRNNKLFVVGSDCIHRFIPQEHRGKTCFHCLATNRKRTSNYCNNCLRRLLRGEVLEKSERKLKVHTDSDESHLDSEWETGPTCKKCGSKCNPKYKFCFECFKQNENSKTKLCSRKDCGNLINPSYTQCYNCRFRLKPG